MRNKMNNDIIMYNLQYSPPINMAQQSNIGEKSRNKMNIDMLAYNLSYSLSIKYNKLYWFVMTVTDRREMRNKMNIDMIMYNLQYSPPSNDRVQHLCTEEKLRNKINIDMIVYNL